MRKQLLDMAAAENKKLPGCYWSNPGTGMIEKKITALMHMCRWDRAEVIYGLKPS
jgi:hypothetical protein